MRVIRHYRDVVGIQRDGSLWVSERPQKFWWVASPSPATVRLGQDFDWKAFAVHGSLAFLVKTNGTLWRLGTNRGNWKSWPGFRAFAPERVGPDSDWADIYFTDHGRMGFQKADGRVWTYPPYFAPVELNGEDIRLDADITLAREQYMDGQRSVAPTWITAAASGNILLGVGKDGVFRLIASWALEPATNGRPQKWGVIPQRIPLSQATNWLALADNHRDVVALKTDGSLWKLNFPADPITKPDSFSATPLSRHSDWVWRRKA